MRNKGELLWWGIFLLFLGAGAFILPMFGRQFIVFTIFGDYASVAAIICIVVGGILVILGIVFKVLRTKKSEPTTLSSKAIEDKDTKE